MTETPSPAVPEAGCPRSRNGRAGPSWGLSWAGGRCPCGLWPSSQDVSPLGSLARLPPKALSTGPLLGWAGAGVAGAQPPAKPTHCPKWHPGFESPSWVSAPPACHTLQRLRTRRRAWLVASLGTPWSESLRTLPPLRTLQGGVWEATAVLQGQPPPPAQAEVSISAGAGGADGPGNAHRTGSPHRPCLPQTQPHLSLAPACTRVARLGEQSRPGGPATTATSNGLHWSLSCWDKHHRQRPREGPSQGCGRRPSKTKVWLW